VLVALELILSTHFDIILHFTHTKSMKILSIVLLAALPVTFTFASFNFDKFQKELIISSKSSEAFIKLNLKEVNAFKYLVRSILQEDYSPLFFETLEANGFKLKCLPSRENCHYLALRSDQSNKYYGTIVFNMKARRNLAIEVPHPKHDSGTLAQGFDFFKVLQARAIIIAGTHRKSNKQEIDCSIPDSRKNKYRISDAAHYPVSLFQIVHNYLDKEKTFFISLHGFSKKKKAPYDVIVSNGVRGHLNKTISNDLSAYIKKELPSKYIVVSCNEKSDNIKTLCGYTNIQGRYSNGSHSTCKQEAIVSSERFIHFEQSLKIRNGKNWKGEKIYFDIIKALKVLIPIKKIPQLPPAHKINNVPSYAQGKNLCGPTSVSNVLHYKGLNLNQYQLGRFFYSLPDDFNWNNYRYTYRGRISRMLNKDVRHTVSYEGPKNFNLLKKLLNENQPIIARIWWSPEKKVKHFSTVIGYDDFSRELIYQESVLPEEKTSTYDARSKWPPEPYERDGNPFPRLPSDPVITFGLVDQRMSYSLFKDLWIIEGSSPSVNYMIHIK